MFVTLAHQLGPAQADFGEAEPVDWTFLNFQRKVVLSEQRTPRRNHAWIGVNMQPRRQHHAVRLDRAISGLVPA